MPEMFAPHARINFAFANCSGSVPSLTPCDRVSASPPAAEQMVRSRRRRSQAMEEAPVHARAVQKPHRAGVAIGQNRLRSRIAPISVSRRAISSSASSQPIRPKRPRPLRPPGASGKAADPDDIRVLNICDFAAQEAARDRVMGVAPQLRGEAARVYPHFQRAGIRAIESAYRFQNHL